MNPDENQLYREKLAGYRLDELIDIEHHIDREAFPERYADLIAEIKIRREKGETVDLTLGDEDPKNGFPSERGLMRKVRAIVLALVSAYFIFLGIRGLGDVPPERGDVREFTGRVEAAFVDSSVYQSSRSFSKRYVKYLTFKMEGLAPYFHYYHGDPNYVSVRNAIRRGGRFTMSYVYDTSRAIFVPVEVIQDGDTITSFGNYQGSKRHIGLTLLLLGICMTLIALSLLLYEFGKKDEAATPSAVRSGPPGSR